MVVGLSLGLGFGGCILALLIGLLIFYLGCCDIEPSSLGEDENAQIEIGGIPLRSKAPNLTSEEIELRETTIRRYKRRLRREALEKRREEARLRREARRQQAAIAGGAPHASASTEALSLLPPHVEGGVGDTQNAVDQGVGSTAYSATRKEDTTFHTPIIVNPVGAAASSTLDGGEGRRPRAPSSAEGFSEKSEELESVVSSDTCFTASTDVYGRAAYEAELERRMSFGLSSCHSSFYGDAQSRARSEVSILWRRDSTTEEPAPCIAGGGSGSPSHRHGRMSQKTIERKKRQLLHARQHDEAALAQHFTKWEITYDPFEENERMDEPSERVLEMEVEERGMEEEHRRGGGPSTLHTSVATRRRESANSRSPEVVNEDRAVGASHTREPTFSGVGSASGTRTTNTREDRNHLPLPLHPTGEDHSPGADLIAPSGSSEHADAPMMPRSPFSSERHPMHQDLTSEWTPEGVLAELGTTGDLRRVPAGATPLLSRDAEGRSVGRNERPYPVSTMPVSGLSSPHPSRSPANPSESHYDPTRWTDGRVAQNMAISGFFLSHPTTVLPPSPSPAVPGE